MEVGIAFISPKLAQEYIWEVAYRWGQYTVKWLDRALLTMQSSSLAYLVVIGANVIFFEVALVISRLGSHLFNPCDEDDVRGEDRERCVCALGLCAVFMTTLGTANWALYNMLHLPLKKWQKVAVSVATCFVYLCYKSA